MKTVFQRFFSSLPVGARLLVLAYALGLLLMIKLGIRLGTGYCNPRWGSGHGARDAVSVGRSA